MSLSGEVNLVHSNHRVSQPQTCEPTQIRLGHSQVESVRAAGQYGPEIRITVLKEIPEDLTLARDWNRLVAQMEHPEVFFTYQWALAVGRAFQATLSPLLFLMYQGNELCGVAALAVDGETGATASFLTEATADYCDVVSTPQTRGEVLACLLREASKLGLRRLCLSYLPSDSFTWKELPAVSRAERFHLARRLGAECGLVEFGTEEQREQVRQAVTHKKRLKKLSKRGPIQITHLVNLGEIDDCLSQIASSQVTRFLATGRISPLVRFERRIFLKELAALLSAQGWLKLSRLEVNDQPVAWNYGFRFGDSWVWYLPSFKLDYEDCSPGSCLLRLLVAEGCADPSLRELDLGRGDESYKAHFATTVRKTYDVELSRSLSRHSLAVARNLMKTGAARLPRAVARLKPLRKLTSSLARRLHSEGLTATIAYTAKRVARLGVSQDEILFFEASAPDRPAPSNMCLDRVTWENLADAAMANDDETDTPQYLLGAAARLKDGKTSGSVLHVPGNQAVHFLFVANADGFHVAEIDHTITGYESQDMMIFDCWTPTRFRGRGYYPLAIRWAAAELMENQRRVWIFCAATNSPSIHGILKAGFVYRYSLVCRRRFGQSTVSRRDRTGALAQFSR
jgi:CelD/BcsL family acetyltransferase involved in cellulose biosynthesis